MNRPLAHRILPLVALACVAFVALACDEDENRKAGEMVGDAVEKSGEATREATDAVGNAVEDAGKSLQDAADDEPGEDLGDE